MNLRTNTALVLGILSLVLLAGSIVPFAHAAIAAHAATVTTPAGPTTGTNAQIEQVAGYQQVGNYQGMFGSQTAPDSGPGSELVGVEIDG
ncbi:MAG: hypothetical protein ACP5ME_14785 [Anaerolineae bacterium]|jgi:hypothetical protein